MADNMPESRRKMIDLMYLVLTALLALNVTREVLDAFDTMNASIERSNTAINDKNGQIYSMFEHEMTTADSNKVRPWLSKANTVKEKTAELIKYLGNWKDSIVVVSGGKTWDPKRGDSIIKNREDISTTTNLFVNQKHGDEIRSKLMAYKNEMLGLIDDPAVKTELDKQFPLEVDDPPASEDNPQGSWTWGTFHNIPVVAGVALLSKYQNDVRNSEGLFLEHFQKQIHKEDFMFNTLKAIAVPNTTYALEGQPIKATIMLAAYNKDAKGMAISSSAGGVPVKDGVGELEFKATGVGTRTVNGTISIDKNGERQSYPFDFSYTVGTAGASLQLDKMNVLYIGVDNPVTLSASGYNIEDVSLSWAGNSGITQTSGSKGHYIVKPKTPGTFEWSINAKSRTGAQTKVSGGQVRVKRIPDPVAEVAQKSSGLVATSTAKAQLGVSAVLKYFDFDAKFQVTEFQFIWVPRNGESKFEAVRGALWNETVKQYISRSKAGDRWFIQNIKAVGPDGTTRSIPPVALTLN